MMPRPVCINTGAALLAYQARPERQRVISPIHIIYQLPGRVSPTYIGFTAYTIMKLPVGGGYMPRSTMAGYTKWQPKGFQPAGSDPNFPR